MQHRPIDEIRRALRKNGATGCTVHAALSGGADSVCLLTCLCRLSDMLSLEIRAIHVQHDLRGEESRRDEAFCIQLCRSLGVPLTIARCDVRSFAAREHLSLETAARECRYKAFETHCPDGYIATAHTASDDLETLLLRLCRGTGLRGLCGIPPVRDRFIRPMLTLSRRDVEAFAREEGLSFVTDSTNLIPDCSRNFLRLRVVPLLRELNPSLERTVSAMLPTLREDLSYLEEEASRALEACRQPDGTCKGLGGLHPALQSRCVGKILEEQGIPATLQRILDVRRLLDTGGSAELERGGRRALVSRDCLYIAPPAEKWEPQPLKIGKNRIYPARYAEVSCILREDAEKFARIYTLFANFVLDYDIIKGDARFHGRLPGLRMQPQGRDHSVSIKKWLGEAIPLSKREQLHFLSDEEGLLWAEGLGAAKRAAVTEHTRRMLYIRVFQ